MKSEITLEYDKVFDKNIVHDEDKQTIFLLMEKMLTIKKFKNFFQKNVAAF